jgi:hypothetical protein
MMTESRLIPWKRIAVEAAAIVASILLAFAIDAWWDERNERNEESEVLLGLKSEFSRYRDEMSESIDIFANNRVLTAELIIATRKGSWDSKTLDIDAAMNAIYDPKSHDFGGGVLDALINSGRLEIISDYDLRVRLANWSQVFGEVRDDEIRNVSFIMDHAIPYMLRWHIPQSRGMELCCPYAEWPLSTGSVADNPDDLSRLLSDPEFEVMVEMRYESLSHVALEYRTALAEMDAIINAIDDSLSN